MGPPKSHSACLTTEASLINAITTLGQSPQSVEELEDRLTTPTAETIDAVARLGGDLLILGAGGKMGPSLAVLARRSLSLSDVRHRVICASRFSAPGVAEQLESAGVETIAADLLDRRELDSLPDAPNVLFLAGMKFGTSNEPELTWALNCYLPAIVAERYRQSRIVALSTGNVYPLVPPSSGGATEETPLDPVGEYAQSCVGRERMFQYMSRQHGTSAVLLRLNYATDLRYGVLLDIAERVYRGKAVDVGMPWVNVIWQGDANAIVVRALDIAAVPCNVLNVTGPEVISVEEVAGHLARRFGLPPPTFVGQQSDRALLSNARRCHDRFGAPRVSTETLIEWVADWVEADRPTLGKPTRFEMRHGSF